LLERWIRDQFGWWNVGSRRPGRAVVTPWRGVDNFAFRTTQLHGFEMITVLLLLFLLYTLASSGNCRRDWTERLRLSNRLNLPQAFPRGGELLSFLNQVAHAKSTPALAANGPVPAANHGYGSIITISIIIRNRRFPQQNERILYRFTPIRRDG
jgi:hypothetical protein